jgi:hypothetical protein
VLCAMFGGPVGAPQPAVAAPSPAMSYAPSAQTHTSHISQSGNTYAPPNQFVAGSSQVQSQVQSTGGTCQQSGLCPVHHVMDCLLCSITGVSIPKKTEPQPQQSYSGQNMYTSPMLGAGSVASSISSLSSADSAFGFGGSSMNPNPIRVQQQQQPSGYHPGAVYGGQFGGGHYPSSSDVVGQHQDGNLGARRSVAPPSADYNLQPTSVQLSKGPKTSHLDSEAEYYGGNGGYSPPKSTLSFASKGKGRGIVYEDESDMVDTQPQQQQLGSVGSRRDHRRIPFNRERYSNVSDASPSEDHDYGGGSGADDSPPSKQSRALGDGGSPHRQTQQHKSIVTQKKMTRKLQNGATIMSSGGKKKVPR